MCWPMQCASTVRKWATVLWVIVLLGTSASADELRIITSYPSGMVKPMLEGFAHRHPRISVSVLNKNTHGIVDEILAGNERHFDLFWASAPEAFVLLDENERLANLGRGPAVDFAYSSVGWTWHASHDGPIPQEWNDLLDPAFAQSIAMAHPLRSGSMHSLLETILQDRGWQAGWAWILELAGQLNTISARSFSVLDGVERGDSTIGLSIDFLAYTRNQRGLMFRYGRPVIIIPARIAALRGGTRPDAAYAFMEFLLSPAGQHILLDPRVRRIPVDPDVRAGMADSIAPSVRAALSFSWSRYDPELAARRYWQVKQLFEAFVARDLLRRRELWRRLRSLDDAPAAEIARIRRLLTWMPLTEHQASSVALGRETLLQWSERSYAILSDVEALIQIQEQPR